LRVAAHVLEGKQVHWGTYHYCGKGVTTWHGFAETIFAMAREYVPLEVKKTQPISTIDYPARAKRPSYSVLDCSLFEKTFNIYQRPWQESLNHMLCQFFSRKKTSE
jgi:dTDP-4-dehydrorhamnose reductase